MTDIQQILNDPSTGSWANLSGANLSEADLRWANLSWANLSGADLSWANLSWTNLSGADLRDANLRRTDLHEANLRDADLRRADLRRADLRKADLRDADLRDADLRDADLRRADLRDADLRRADLRRADLWNTIGDGAIIRSAQFEKYLVVICDDWLQIGCQGHRLHEWVEFDDATIKEMDRGALKWWRKYKSAVMAFANAGDFGL